MKYIYTTVITLYAVLFLASCHQPDAISMSEDSSVTAISVKFPGSNRTFPGVIDGDTITCDVPIYQTNTEELIETDISKMEVVASIPQGAIITPELSSLRDFNQPQQFTVKAANGDTKTYILKIRKTGMEYTMGLLEFAVQKNNGVDMWYQSSAVPPYEDGQTIFIDVPDTPKDPLDLTKLKVKFKLQPTCSIEPALDSEFVDFTEPVEIKVTDGLERVRTLYIQIRPTAFNKTKVSHLWFRSVADLDLTRSNIKDIALTKDYFAIGEFNDWSLGSIYLFDTSQGRPIKTVEQPTTMTHRMTTDDSDQLVINTYNESGKGYEVHVNNKENTAWAYTFRTVGWHSVVEELPGYTTTFGTNRTTVTGDMKKGKAYVYTTTTTPLFPKYYWWELNDGVVVLSSDKTSVNPTGNAVYSRAGAKWDIASVKRASTDAKSDIYFCWYDQGSSETDGKGSRFEIQDGQTGAYYQLNPENHFYKILAFDVFTLHGDTFVAMLTQGMKGNSEARMMVFDITDKSKLSLSAEDPDYVPLKMYESSPLGITTDFSSGDVKVNVIDDLNADIFVACTATTSATAGNAGVRKFQIQYILE